jgi:hypothetical protein
MIPMKTITIFRSRWMALIWAAGIIWFAVDVAGTPSDGNQSASADTNEAQIPAVLDPIK